MMDSPPLTTALMACGDALTPSKMEEALLGLVDPSFSPPLAKESLDPETSSAPDVVGAGHDRLEGGDNAGGREQGGGHGVVCGQPKEQTTFRAGRWSLRAFLAQVGASSVEVVGGQVERSPGGKRQRLHSSQAGSMLEVPVPHVLQKRSWDCGVACVQMILSFVGRPRTFEELSAVLGATSVWTIDLVYLLRTFEFPFPCLFCTATVGAEESHSSLDFYKAEFDSDAVRINKLFQDAAEAGLSIEQTSVAQADLQALVSSCDILVIILLDFRIIRPQPRLFGSSSYTGHYVVLCGFDNQAQVYSYRDPARPAERCFVTAAALDRARFADGTDEDLVIIDVSGFSFSPQSVPVTALDSSGMLSQQATGHPPGSSGTDLFSQLSSAWQALCDSFPTRPATPTSSSFPQPLSTLDRSAYTTPFHLASRTNRGKEAGPTTSQWSTPSQRSTSSPGLTNSNVFDPHSDENERQNNRKDR